MPTLRDIRRKINSIKSTQTITRTMKMVASSRLRRAQEELERIRNYANRFEELKERLIPSLKKATHPLLKQKDEEKRALIFVIASDRGLCGSFNVNVNLATENFINSVKDKYEDIALYVVGKKVKDYFLRRNVPIVKEWIELRRIEPHHVEEMTKDLISYYENDDFQRIYGVYTFYRSPIRQEVKLEEMIPILPREEREPIEYLYEPSEEYIVNHFIPRYLETKIRYMILNSQTSEHASRMNAMENATNNCGELIRMLTLIYNKKRQENITKEMLDIVGGAEAVKTVRY